MFEIEPSWKMALQDELEKAYLIKLAAFIERERLYNGPVYPPASLVFNALWLTPFDKVSVVIVGQDPYHGPGQAHGLCFSVPKGVAIPPSLRNIYKEISEDIGAAMPSHGCLIDWAEQGVLLLNTLMTVREKSPMSHEKQGWEQFTDAVIFALAKRSEPLVFLLWGAAAQKKWQAVAGSGMGHQHLILKAAHPSPLSAHSGFLGCRHFSEANHFLKQKGKNVIEWAIK